MRAEGRERQFPARFGAQNKVGAPQYRGHFGFHLVVVMRDAEVDFVPVGVEEEPGVVAGVAECLDVAERRNGVSESVPPIAAFLEGEVDLNGPHGGRA